VHLFKHGPERQAILSGAVVNAWRDLCEYFSINQAISFKRAQLAREHSLGYTIDLTTQFSKPFSPVKN